MYTYSIFSIKTKIATHYIYKTSILYRFLKEFKEGPQHPHLQLQYNYCVEPMDLQTVANEVENVTMDVEIEKRNQYMTIYWKGKSLTIYEDDRHVEVQCQSIEDIEEFFFPLLRKSPGYLFVICNRMKDYGWLSMKDNRIMSKQILYSFH